MDCRCVDYLWIIVMILSAVHFDSHSDGTHSLQKIEFLKICSDDNSFQ